ncbi:hypothetical protein B0T22DRAFT_479956 [Podospora appendiculata]|uniref:Uncharacterized protein n=1 Tax=Podospora appendiculata TaxID=314037 RepID=A0AAE1CCP1_9PEZI|nr:hypothetical protein B0T22DRAFT_479956 [Podospora appendiculata]
MDTGSSTNNTGPSYSRVNYNSYFDPPFQQTASSRTPPNFPGASYQGWQHTSNGYQTEQPGAPSGSGWTAMNAPSQAQPASYYSGAGSNDSYPRLSLMNIHTPQPLRPLPGQYTAHLGPNPLSRPTTPHPLGSTPSKITAYGEDFNFGYGYTSDTPGRMYRESVASNFMRYPGMPSPVGGREVWTGGMPSSGRDSNLKPPPPRPFPSR